MIAWDSYWLFAVGSIPPDCPFGLGRGKAAPPRNSAPPEASISMFWAIGKCQARGRDASKSTTFSIARRIYKSPAKRR
jgi:hypothetical protein